MALQMTAPAGGNAIAANLRDLTYLGAQTQLTLSTPGNVPLMLSMPTAALPSGLTPNAQVWVAWPDDQGRFL